MAVSSTSSGSLKTGVCLSTDRPDNPYNGQVIYETDTNRVLVYDNSAWVVVANAASTGFPSSLDTNTVDSIAALQAKVGVDSSAVTSSLDYKVAQLEASGTSGLVTLSETSFSATATAQFTSAFSATYTNYRAILSVTATAGLAFYLRLLVGSTVQTGNILSIQQGTALSTATLGVSTRSDQYGLGFVAFTTYPSRFVIDFFSPFATDYTTYDVSGVGGRSNTDSDALRASCRNIATTSIDGFEITTASGNTLTGTMTLYGVRNA